MGGSFLRCAQILLHYRFPHKRAMVALPFPLSSAGAVADDTKLRTTPSSTNTPNSSRCASESEQCEVVDLSSLDQELKSLQWLENARLKAEIDCFARRNLDLRIKILDEENAFLRARIAGESLIRGVADAGIPKPNEKGESLEVVGSTQLFVDGGSSHIFPPGVWMSSNPEEARLAAMAVWNASEHLRPKTSRSSRRRAARRKAKVVALGADASHVPWHLPGAAPFQLGWQALPGMTVVTHQDVRFEGSLSVQDGEDEEVVTLSDSGEEEETDEEDTLGR